MSKDLINETFQKHLGLLRKRLNENGDISIEENDQSSSEHLKKFSPEDLIFNPEKVVSTNEAILSGDKSLYTSGAPFDDDQEFKKDGVSDKNPKELQKRLFKAIVEIPIFKFFLDEKHKVISIEPKEIRYNELVVLGRGGRLMNDATTFILKAFSKDGKELGTAELVVTQNPGLFNKILSGATNFIPFLKTNIKQTIAVQDGTGVFTGAKYLDDVGFVLHQVYINHWGTRGVYGMGKQDYFKGTADYQDVSRAGEAPPMLGAFRQ